MNELEIYLDVDGPLTDFVGGAFRLYGLSESLARTATSYDAVEVDISTHLGREVTREEFESCLKSAGADFWAHLDWTPWGQRVLAACLKEAGPRNVTLLTKPSTCPSSAAGKMSWIRAHMPTSLCDTWAISPSKHKFAHAGALLIDDDPKNVAAFRATRGGHAYLFPMPYNAKAVWPDRGCRRRARRRDPLHEIEAAMTRRIIALSGAQGVGKSTIALLLERDHGFTRTRFAGPFKDGLKVMFGLTDEEIDGPLKGRPTPKLGGHTPRHAMRTIGTEWGQAHLGKSIWADVWANRLPPGDVVVDDLRHDHEYNAVRRVGGRVVEVTRPGVCRSGTHSSDLWVPPYDLEFSNHIPRSHLADAVAHLLDEVEDRIGWP